MIKEVSVIKAFDDYRKAMDYAKTILEDVVLLTLHGEDGKKLHGTISKINIQEIIYLFDEKKEWQGLTDEEIKATWSQLWHDLNNGKFAASDDPSQTTTVMFARAIEVKLKEKNT